MVFIKKVENFECEKCGAEIVGDGFTNHCPKCLWSKHVDIDPGDRESKCKGIMEPVGLIIEGGERRIIHKCKKCNNFFKIKVAVNDNEEKIIDISKNPVIC